MKKFFAIIAAVFIMVVSFALPISVYADDSYYHLDTGNDPFRYPNDFYSISDFYDMTSGSYAVGSDLQSKGHFLRLLFDSNRSGTRGTAHGFMFVYGDDVSVEYDSEFNVLTLTGVNNNDQPIKGYYERSADCQNASRTATIRFKCDCYKLEIDFNSSISTLYYSGGSRTLEYYCSSNLSNPGNIFYSEAILDVPPVDPNALNVSVSFVPALSGQVDRSVTTSDGSTALRQKLIMNVINNSSFPIQYDMYIMKKNIVSVRGGYMDLDSDDASRISTATTRFDDDPAFIFYSDSWVYTHGMDSELSYWDNNTYKYNKSSRWHYLGSGSSVVQEFDFSQIHLNEGEEYTVYVRAVRNDYGIASEKIVYLSSSDPAYPELKQIQGDDIETVYYSDFSMIQYNDVVYDPNNSMNGVKPYDGQNGIYDRERYAWSRNASEDDNGNIDYSSVNHLDNKNSWINQQYGGVVNNHNKLVSGSLSFSSLNSIISPVVLFVSSTFTFLPDPLQLSFYLGFFAIVVLAVIKKVFV